MLKHRYKFKPGDRVEELRLEMLPGWEKSYDPREFTKVHRTGKFGVVVRRVGTRAAYVIVNRYIVKFDDGNEWEMQESDLRLVKEAESGQRQRE